MKQNHAWLVVRFVLSFMIKKCVDLSNVYRILATDTLINGSQFEGERTVVVDQDCTRHYQALNQRNYCDSPVQRVMRNHS